MEVIGLITARKNSQRVPGKNMKILGGKPLLSWTLESASKSILSDNLYISSDCPLMIELAHEFGVQNKGLRPSHLCDSSTTTHEVILDFLDTINLRHSSREFAVVLLQPTSPFRSSSDIDLAIELIRRYPLADSLVSVTRIPEWVSFSKRIRLNSEGMVSDFEAKTMENQLGAVEMIRNGPAILATRSRVIESSLYGKSTLPFEMPFFRSIDLNTFEDFQLAEIIARNL